MQHMFPLHSNLVLFKWISFCMILICTNLYIPIWFYSNQTVFLNKLCQACFTFQSGSIQIASINLYPLPGKHFTFQSGSIQIIICLKLCYAFRNFTFQSGSIQMYISANQDNIVSTFTFQSGSIQIRWKADTFLKKTTLHSNLVLFKFFYVDFPHGSAYSLHSNLVLFKCNGSTEPSQIVILYIPIWFYSNEMGIDVLEMGASFTFQSGSIQMLWRHKRPRDRKTLHSNLVLFKYWTRFSTGRVLFLYIPIWFYSN